jgi:hypothetical protein
MDLVDELKPGAWSSVEVVLSPTKSDELQFLQVGMDASELSLTKPQPASQ